MSKRHKISFAEFAAIRDDNGYYVVAFDREGTRRVTIGGCTIIRAMHEVMRLQIGGEVLVIRNLPGGELSWDRADYNKYLKVQS